MFVDKKRVANAEAICVAEQKQMFAVAGSLAASAIRANHMFHSLH